MKIAFDIDDTLWKINVKHLRQEPDYELIQVLKWFYNNGDEVLVWSAGGVDYAQTIVDKLGFTDMVKVIPKKLTDDMDTPDLTFDDENVRLGRVNIRVKRDRRPDDFIHTENPYGKILKNTE